MQYVITYPLTCLKMCSVSVVKLPQSPNLFTNRRATFREDLCTFIDLFDVLRCVQEYFM